MTTPSMRTLEDMKKEAHMKALGYSKGAKSLGELTVVPIGYVSKIVGEAIIDRDNALREAVEGMRKDMIEISHRSIHEGNPLSKHAFDVRMEAINEVLSAIPRHD